MSTDTEHHLNREIQERALARTSADLRIAAIHTAMADTYAARVGTNGSDAAPARSTTAVVTGYEAQRLGG